MLKIPYQGKEYSLKEILEENNISETVYRRHYINTGNRIQDIINAIEKCKKLKRLETVDYKGEKLSLTAIAKRIGISNKTLKKYLTETGDIYKAVERCLEIKSKRDLDGQIEYNGEQLNLNAISQREGIPYATLATNLKRTNNIYDAVELTKATKRKKEESLVVYKGEKRPISWIAKKENVARSTLERYFKKYQNIDKAIFMARIQKVKNTKVKINGTNVSVSDLSIILGIKVSKLVSLLNKGMTIEEIKNQKIPRKEVEYKKQKYTVLPNGQTLLEYCIENKLNYSSIYRAINVYGKSLEEATEQYKKEGQTIPGNWIFKRYGVLLRHLLLENNVNIDNVVRYMRENQMSIGEAIEKYIIRKNAKEQKLDADWMEELYPILTDEKIGNEYDDFKKTFFITDNEEKCVLQSNSEIENIKRTLLLFEIADAIKDEIFSQEELPALLQIYGIKPEEIETIFLELYSKFDGNRINGENSTEMKRKRIINEITRKWYYLGQEERDNVLVEKGITDEEKRMIVDLSNKIVKYKEMLKVKENEVKALKS